MTCCIKTNKKSILNIWHKCQDCCFRPEETIVTRSKIGFSQLMLANIWSSPNYRNKAKHGHACFYSNIDILRHEQF